MGKFFIARPIFAIALAAAIVLLGIISIFDLPIEQYPDITPPVSKFRRPIRCRCRNREQCGRHARFAEHHRVSAICSICSYERQRRVDESAGDLRYRIRSEHGAIFTQNNVSTALSQLPASVTQQGVTTRKTMTGFLIVYSLTSDGRYTGDFLSNYAISTSRTNC